jgi:putative PIG3 family NAD(P)H quinone oxidoreductase
MTAIAIDRPGGPEVLQKVEAVRPWPKEGEVLIEVHAAGVNRPDILQRLGVYRPPSDASSLPGLEVAGIVLETGLHASRYKKGDEVVALTNGGGYSEYVTAPQGQVLSLPKAYSMIEGASLPETFFTIQQTLIDRAGLTRGQTVLVHGAAGGLGATALQFARLHGAIPYATASSPEKADYARAMGAESTIDYLKQDFVEKARELTGGRGVDMVLDIVGGDYLERNLRALARSGTLIQLALLGGADANVDLGLLLHRHLTVFGSTLRPLSGAAKAEVASHLFDQVWPALEDGTLHKPRIETFALEDAAKAHRAMDAPSHMGKIVLVTTKGRE